MDETGGVRRKYNSYIEDLRDGRNPEFPERTQRRIRPRVSGSITGMWVFYYIITIRNKYVLRYVDIHFLK
jgi:hypothetical protein